MLVSSTACAHTHTQIGHTLGLGHASAMELDEILDGVTMPDNCERRLRRLRRLVQLWGSSGAACRALLTARAWGQGRAP